MEHTSSMANNSPERLELSGRSNDLSFLFPEDKPARNSKKGIYCFIGLQGEALIEIDGKAYQFKEGTLICLTPNHLLSRYSQSDDFQFECLFVEYDLLSEFPLFLKAEISDNMGIIPFTPLSSLSFNLLVRCYDFIISRHQNVDRQPEAIRGLLFTFILELNWIYSGRRMEVTMSRKDELIDRFFRLLHNHYKTERTAAFYAGQLCISNKYLLRVIKEVTGKTFYYWVSDFIIKEAKILLKSTQMSVTAISEELQFPNSSFFARFFRRHTGSSPMQFKKGT